jgi:biotin carboxyl carrier protein
MEDLKPETTETIKYESLEVYEGAKFKTLLTKKHHARKAWEPENLAMVSSFIPGTIRKILVKEGQIVKKGETLLILEAMKMLNNISAGTAGKVKAVHTKIGVVVTKNQLLVELDPIAEKKKRRKT